MMSDMRGRLSISANSFIEDQRTVTLQRYTQIFCRNIIAPTPLAFELRTLIGKTAGEAFDDVSHKCVALFDCATGFVHKGSLNLCPTIAKIRRFVFRK